MSDIDFQNGFLCGMATKGLVKNVGTRNATEELELVSLTYDAIEFIDTTLELEVLTLV